MEKRWDVTLEDNVHRICSNGNTQTRENSAYQHCLKEGGKVVSKVFLLNWMNSHEFDKLTFFLKVFCLPHYYRKDVIPPTGASLTLSYLRSVKKWTFFLEFKNFKTLLVYCVFWDRVMASMIGYILFQIISGFKLFPIILLAPKEL